MIGLYEELHQHVLSLCSDSLSYADLPGSLSDGNKHYVHYSYTADYEGYSGDAREDRSHVPSCCPGTQAFQPG